MGFLWDRFSLGADGGIDRNHRLYYFRAPFRYSTQWEAGVRGLSVEGLQLGRQHSQGLSSLLLQALRTAGMWGVYHSGGNRTHHRDRVALFPGGLSSLVH